MGMDQTRMRFYLEASVGLAKASVFLATAEDNLSRGDFLSAYYSVFHLAQALMWLFVDQLPDKSLTKFTDIRIKGGGLPSAEVKHADVEKFLCDGQLKLSNTKSLCSLFRDAQELREFANYGPRVTWSGTQPIVGPCHLSTTRVESVVARLRPEFISTMKLASPETAMKGILGRIVLHQAIELLKDAKSPFSAWSSGKAYKEAVDLLEILYKEPTSK